MESTLSTKVQLFLSARNLKNMDTFSKSDPFCKVFMFAGNNQLIEVFRTEVLQDDLNPNWVKRPELDFLFETQQLLRFEVHDSDGRTSDFIGSVETSMGEIVGRGVIMLDLKSNNATTGKLIIRAEEITTENHQIILHLRAHHVDKMDWFGKSDPYLMFYRVRNTDRLLVHKTEVVMKTLDPIWKPIELSSRELCNGNFQEVLEIECWDWDRTTRDDFIGKCQVSLEQLVGQDNARFDLINPEKKARSKKYTNSGVLEVQYTFIKRIPTFINYLRGGTQLRLLVAIDFTASNQHPSSSNSLHFICSASQNEYEKAILAVGSILENYDTSQMYPVYGFGGKPPGLAAVDHCFPLNGSYENPFVCGVGGILEIYHNALRTTELAGPTYFSKIIEYCMQIAAPSIEVYNVLLILTDGEIHDMPRTKSLIVEASHLPMSIIIVGLGSANFSQMEQLDSDESLLRDDSGQQAVRDIVQFVPFRQFAGNQYALAREVLAELPKQLCEHMQRIGHEPVPVDVTLPSV